MFNFLILFYLKKINYLGVFGTNLEKENFGNPVICGLHFEPSMFQNYSQTRLKDCAVPHLPQQEQQVINYSTIDVLKGTKRQFTDINYNSYQPSTSTAKDLPNKKV